MICPLSPTRVYDDKGDERNDRSNTKKTLRQRLCMVADGWPIMLLSAKQETSRLLGEDAENRQARQMIMRRRSTEQLKRSDALLRYSFFYSGDNDYRNSVVSFCNTALLLISDFFSIPLAKQKEA